MYDASYGDISLPSNISNDINIFSSIYEAWNYARSDLSGTNGDSSFSNDTSLLNYTDLNETSTFGNYDIILLSNLSITQETEIDINMTLNSSLEITIGCDKSYLYDWSGMTMPSNINQWCHIYQNSAMFLSFSYDDQDRNVTITVQSMSTKLR